MIKVEKIDESPFFYLITINGDEKKFTKLAFIELYKKMSEFIIEKNWITNKYWRNFGKNNTNIGNTK